MAEIPGLSLGIVEAAWGWSGLTPERLIARNAFGNLIVEDESETLWRIMPEELSCAPLGLPTVPWEAPAFRQDWDMRPLVRKAEAALGPLKPHQSYQIVLPGPLGGTYEADNMAICDITSLMELYGALAFQVAQLPDGAEVGLALAK